MKYNSKHFRNIFRLYEVIEKGENVSLDPEISFCSGQQ